MVLNQRFLWRLFLIVIGLVLCYQLWLLGHVFWWVQHNPSTSAFMEARLNVMQDKNPDAELHHKWVPYEKISKHLKRAVIASEDAKFLQHEGFDWEGMQDAWEKNLKKGKIVAGGSTISQQLAKNLFLSGKRTPWRKMEAQDFRDLSERYRVGRWRIWRRGGGSSLLWQVSKKPVGERGRQVGSNGAESTLLR